MEEWKEYKLGEIAEFRTGKLNSNASVDKGKYPFFTCSPETYFINDYAFDQKAILLAGNNAEGNFNVKYYEGKFNAYQRTYVINPIHDNVGIHFLYYALQLCLQSLKLLSQGTSTKFLTAKILNAFSIQVPPRIVQDKIVSIIKSLDDKIEVNRRINENLEQQAQALFKSWFVDFEPFRDGEFVESELGMIPKGWRVESLTRFGKIVCGKTPSKAESTYYGGNIPFIKIPDMHNNVFVLQSEDYLSELGDMSQIGKRIPPYSVLVSCIATVGLVGMNVRTCHTNQQINSIIPNSPKYRYYLYQKLVTLKDYINNLGRGGTATLNVNTRQFGSIEIIKPSDNVLSDYHQKVSCLFDKIKAISKESRRLAELRDTLLPKLMSGELKVNDIN